MECVLSREVTAPVSASQLDIREIEAPRVQARQAIGVFDSGSGGMVTASHLAGMRHDVAVVFFGDTANLPYGKKMQVAAELAYDKTRVQHRDPPLDLPHAVEIVARDAQKLVAAVDVAHILDDEGQVKLEWRD